MHDEELLRPPAHLPEPPDYAFPVDVRREAVDVPHFGLDRQLEPHQLDPLRPLEYLPPERPLGLVAHEQHRILVVPEVVLEVELYPPRRAHAVAGDDDAGPAVVVHRGRVVYRLEELQLLERERRPELVPQ